MQHLRLRLRLINAVLFFCPQFCFNRVRTLLYRLCGVQIGVGTVIAGTMTLSGGGPIFSRLKIGNSCFINSHVYIDLNAPVTIGDRVYIGHHTIIITSSHEIGSAYQRCGIMHYEPISVGDGCWIGADVTILPGVKIGVGCVVGAGALVNKDVLPNTFVAGVPARTIRSLD